MRTVISCLLLSLTPVYAVAQTNTNPNPYLVAPPNPGQTGGYAVPTPYGGNPGLTGGAGYTTQGGTTYTGQGQIIAPSSGPPQGQVGVTVTVPCGRLCGN